MCVCVSLKTHRAANYTGSSGCLLASAASGGSGSYTRGYGQVARFDFLGD